VVLIASLLMAASVGCYTYSVGSVCFECCRIECGEAERVARGRHGIISSIRHQKLTNFRQDEQQLCCCLIALSAVRSFFAQQDHMQVFKFVLDCLDVFHI